MKTEKREGDARIPAGSVHLGPMDKLFKLEQLVSRVNRWYEIKKFAKSHGFDEVESNCTQEIAVLNRQISSFFTKVEGE